MKRRSFTALMTGAAIWPLAARADAPLPVIGLLGSATLSQWTARLRAFREGLHESGFDEGRNVAIEYRWAEGRNDRLLSLAAELVARRVSVIVVLGNTTSLLAAKAATTSIPIVFRVAVDPVQLGIAASLARPGGNLTGVTTMGAQLGSKQLEVLREALPKATEAGLLINPTNTVLAEMQLGDMPAAARALGLRLHIVRASTSAELDAAVARLAELRVAGFAIGVDAFFNSHNERLAELAIRHALPAISPYREFAEAGGLLSYGGSIPDASKHAGIYTGRVLKGERPADMPIQMSVKIEFVVNLKTARLLGLALPDSVVLRADEVIE